MRIIEIRIKTEEDINDLVSSSIEEDPLFHYGIKGCASDGRAVFYNFKQVSQETKPLMKRSIQRFYLFRSGLASVSNYEVSKSCRKVKIKDNKSSIFEVSIDSSSMGEHSLYEYGYMVARNNGIPTKTCLFCKYHRIRNNTVEWDNPNFCCLYKQYGTPEIPKLNEAKQCKYYRENEVLLQSINNTMPAIVTASLNDYNYE